MNNFLRYRSKGGAVVTWRKTGKSGCYYNYDVGDIECLGCGMSERGLAASHAEGHAGSCKALG